MVKDCEDKIWEDRLRLPVLFTLEKRKLRCDLTAVYNFLKGSSRGRGADLHSLVTSDKT